MELDILFRELESMTRLSSGLREALKEELLPASLPKNHFLLQPPAVSEMAYYIVKGFALSFVLVDGAKKVEWFWKRNQLILSPKSFFEVKPAREFIVLADDSELLCISYRSLSRMQEDFQEASHLVRLIMTKYYEHSRRRIRELHSLTAEERFRRLVTAYPGVEQLVSQESIASYLGITPQSLSRIKRMTEK